MPDCMGRFRDCWPLYPEIHVSWSFWRVVKPPVTGSYGHCWWKRAVMRSVVAACGRWRRADPAVAGRRNYRLRVMAKTNTVYEACAGLVDRFQAAKSPRNAMKTIVRCCGWMQAGTHERGKSECWRPGLSSRATSLARAANRFMAVSEWYIGLLSETIPR